MLREVGHQADVAVRQRRDDEVLLQASEAGDRVGPRLQPMPRAIERLLLLFAQRREAELAEDADRASCGADRRASSTAARRCARGSCSARSRRATRPRISRRRPSRVYAPRADAPRRRQTIASRRPCRRRRRRAPSPRRRRRVSRTGARPPRSRRACRAAPPRGRGRSFEGSVAGRSAACAVSYTACPERAGSRESTGYCLTSSTTDS